MSAKKLTGIASIAIAASFVLIVAMPVKPPERVYPLAYAEDGRDSYSAGGSVYLSHHLLIMIINEKIEPISDML